MYSKQLDAGQQCGKLGHAHKNRDSEEIRANHHHVQTYIPARSDQGKLLPCSNIYLGLSLPCFNISGIIYEPGVRSLILKNPTISEHKTHH